MYINGGDIVKIEKRTRSDSIDEIASELGELMYAFNPYEVRDSFDDFDYDEYISTLASDLHDPKYRAEVIDYIRDILEELETDDQYYDDMVQIYGKLVNL